MFSKNIFDQLSSEHSELKVLFQKAKDSQQLERKELIDEIESRLVPHARAEEKTLYAALYNNVVSEGDEATQINHAYDQHATVNELLGDLKETAIDDDQWMALLQYIKDYVTHHIEEEERELFDLAKSVLDDKDLEKISEAYNEQKEIFTETVHVVASCKSVGRSREI